MAVVIRADISGRSVAWVDFGTSLTDINATVDRYGVDNDCIQMNNFYKHLRFPDLDA